MLFELLFLFLSAVNCEASLYDSNQQPVTIGDFPFSFSPESRFRRGQKIVYDTSQLDQLFDQYYYSGRRITHHGVHLKDTNKVLFNVRDQIISLEADIIFELLQSLENGVRQGWIRHLFFPDAGHAHLMVPDQQTADYDLSDPMQLSQLINSGNFALLLHVNEQFDWSSIEIGSCEHEVLSSQRNLLFKPSSQRLPEESSLQVLALEKHAFSGNWVIRETKGWKMAKSQTLYFHSSNAGEFDYYHEGENQLLKIDFSFRFH